jgi:hypothetical protein
MRPLRVGEDLVPTDARQEAASARRLEQRHVEVRVAGPEKPVPAKDASSDGAEAIEVASRVHANPVVQAEVRHDALLPLRLLRVVVAGEAVRGRDRERQLLAPREPGRHREDGRRIPAAREAHEARCPPQGREDGLLERGERIVERGRRQPRRLHAEHQPGGQLEPG